MKKLLSLALAAALLALSACAPGAPSNSPGQNQTSQSETSPGENAPAPPQEPEEPVPPPDPRQEAVDTILSSMTLEEKVGQMFFVRCPEFDAVADISAYHLGGYLLFGRDFQDRTPSDVKDLTGTFQAMAEIPLLIGTDEEGGTVDRLRSMSSQTPIKYPSPQALYAQGGLEAVRDDAINKSGVLLQLGINVNFAPVADVSTDPNDFMYDRAFGQDAQATAEYVETVVSVMDTTKIRAVDSLDTSAFEEGGTPRGIGSVLKHFPGYGNNVDTHTGIAVDQRPYETFVESDFLPFQAGIAAGADSVLVSHNIVTCMDGGLPASLSPEVHRVLREELGFTGVVLTDDLAMDAVEAYAEDGSVAVLAVLAGNDMVVTTDYRTQIPLVIAAVEDGTIPERTIDQAVSRVLGWKYDLGLLG